jgi:hypothetical protein
VKDANVPDVHNGLSGASNPASTTSWTALGEIHIALESGQDAGVWGGMSEDERRALLRRNALTRTRSA